MRKRNNSGLSVYCTYHQRLRTALFVWASTAAATTTNTDAFTPITKRSNPIRRTVSIYNSQQQQQQQPSQHYDKDSFESLIDAATTPAKGQAPLGGDFAGLAATFDPGDGSFIPIPEYLIPPSLLEWGQEPKCLEVLVSEDISIISDVDDDENDDTDGNSSSTMTRITTTVLPDTGCSVDNLETLKAIDEIDLASQWSCRIEEGGLQVKEDDTATVVGLQYPLPEDSSSSNNEAVRVETIFGLEAADDGKQYRMRVAIDVVPSPSTGTFGIQSPMVLTLERRTNAYSSGGTISDGGGLDGRTVTMLLGERLSGSKTFVDDPPLSENYYKTPDSIKHVAFPGNVSIAYGWLTDDDWVLQVGHVGPNGMRRVVSRQFTVLEDGELDFEIRSWVENPQEVAVH